MSIETKPPRIGWYGSQEAHDDHMAWRREWSSNNGPKRDQAGWWQPCPHCGEYTYRMWRASEHRGVPFTHREGVQHRCEGMGK